MRLWVAIEALPASQLFGSVPGLDQSIKISLGKAWEGMHFFSYKIFLLGFREKTAFNFKLYIRLNDRSK